MKRTTTGHWGALVCLLTLGLGPGCGGGEGNDGGAGGDETGTDDGADGAKDDDDDDDENDDDDDADGGSGDVDDDTQAMRPNWHEDIAPLVTEHCGACHDGGLAFAMDDYEETRPWAEVMAIQTEARNMPPWHAVATDDCAPPLAFEDDPRLSDEDIAMFQQWADLGTPEGDPANAASLPDISLPDLEDPDVTMAMGGSLEIAATDTALDFFHCISLDPGNDEDVFIDGLQFFPGNDEVIHHVVMYVDLEGQSAGWTDGISNDCGNGPNVTAATTIGSWLPGQHPTLPPDGVGMRLPAGARIVLNMHYHADVLGPQTDDASALALRYADQTPAWISETRLFGNPGSGTSTTGEFLIPAGAAGHDEVFEFTVPNEFDSVRAWGVLNHMHKIAVAMKVEVVRADGGDDVCLVNTPEYDYNWQRYYEYDVPIDEAPELRAGDTLRITCTYDNVIENPGVADALGELGLSEPQDVTQGDGTLDEMCVAGIGLAIQP